MTKKIKLTIVFAVSFVTICSAGAPPPPPKGNPGCWPPPCVPIDGGISLLIAAGAIYGGKKLYSINNQK